MAYALLIWWDKCTVLPPKINFDYHTVPECYIRCWHILILLLQSKWLPTKRSAVCLLINEMFHTSVNISHRIQSFSPPTSFPIIIWPIIIIANVHFHHVSLPLHPHSPQHVHHPLPPFFVLPAHRHPIFSYLSLHAVSITILASFVSVHVLPLSPNSYAPKYMLFQATTPQFCSISNALFLKKETTKTSTATRHFNISSFRFSSDTSSSSHPLPCVRWTTP